MNDEKEAELEKLGVRSKHNSNFFIADVSLFIKLLSLFGLSSEF
jgi:hypothetical protein